LPNIQSAKKRVKVSEKKNLQNRIVKSGMRTSIRKFDAAVAGGGRAQADAAFKTAVKSVDQAAKKGLLHKNTAARKKSSMAVKMNKLA
jgi:small subunit ribosomal protein S20